MISFISRKIVRYLEKNETISRDKMENYQYGFEIFISSIMTLAIAIISGLVQNCFIASIIFFIIFATLRQICGGYHSEHYWSCNLIFLMVVNFVLLIYKFMPMNQYEIAHYVFLASSLLIIYVYAPVGHKNKPLSNERRKAFRLISRIVVSFLTITSCLIYIIYDSTYTKLIDATLLAVSLSITVVVINEGREKNESNQKDFS